MSALHPGTSCQHVEVVVAGNQNATNQDAAFTKLVCHAVASAQLPNQLPTQRSTLYCWLIHHVLVFHAHFVGG